jgi:Cdc6-like AAA superfamily ATPase
MYISGQPGTGKTLTVQRVLNKVLVLRRNASLPQFHLVQINALNDLPTPETLFSRIYADVTREQLRPKSAQALMTEKWFTTDNTKAPHYIVLFLDELDSLLRNPKVIHTLMDWMARPASRLLIVGISNTIDLLERLEAKTQSRGALVSKILFMPYSWKNIMEILQSRLASASAIFEETMESPFDDKALELCAKKTGNDRGDIRRALQVCLRVVEKFEEELISDPTLKITLKDMQAGLSELKSGSFPSALRNLALYEKLFMWAFARQCFFSGDMHASYYELESRLSETFAQVMFPQKMEDPGRSVWEQICDALGKF